MTRISGTNSSYNWNTSTPTLAARAYSVTVSGTDTIGNATGTDNTFTISPTFYLDTNGVTENVADAKCDQRLVNGVIYTAQQYFYCSQK